MKWGAKNKFYNLIEIAPMVNKMVKYIHNLLLAYDSPIITLHPITYYIYTLTYSILERRSTVLLLLLLCFALWSNCVLLILEKHFFGKKNKIKNQIFFGLSRFSNFWPYLKFLDIFGLLFFFLDFFLKNLDFFGFFGFNRFCLIFEIFGFLDYFSVFHRLSNILISFDYVWSF